jgi:hypothetical protein
MDSPFSRLKVVQLKEHLSALGLSTKGQKRDLVERLEGAMVPGLDVDDNKNDRNDPANEESIKSVPGPADAAIPDQQQIEETGENVENNAHGNEFSGKTMELDERVHEDNQHTNPPSELDTGDPPQDNAKGDWAPQICTSSDKCQSSIVKISNFVRPFTLESVQAMLSQYGMVTAFWMDKLRTMAFVEYESIEAARLCQFHINGLQWPAVTGRQLAVEFSSPELMNAAMNAPVLPDVNPASYHHHHSAQHHPQPHAISKSTETKTLDDLFSKTQTRPHIYYLPRHKN